MEEDHLTELEEAIEDLRRELQDRDGIQDRKERELVESKDRITALENQIIEYAGTIQDQSKVGMASRCICRLTVLFPLKLIQSSLGTDSSYSQQLYNLEQLYKKAIEYAKKQQIEFQEKLSYFHTQYDRFVWLILIEWEGGEGQFPRG